MLGGNINKDAVKKLTDAVKFTEAFGMVKGMPFKFYDEANPKQDRRHLYEIYRDSHPRQIILAGRQVEKSETVNRKLVHNAFTMPYTTQTYVSPRLDQTYRFSNDRFRNSLKMSKGGVLMQSLEKDSTKHMTFSNYHQIYFGSSYGEGDSLRGISGDVITFDEMQDIEEEAISTLTETLSHSEVSTEIQVNGKTTELKGKILITGTPKQTGSLYEKYWDLSDQRVWNKKKMTWEPTKDPEKCLFRGYHMPQTMMPWISEEELDFKKQTYSEQKYVNEVLGEFYSGLLKPLTMRDIEPCLDANRPFLQELPIGRESYMGIDWGGGVSAFTVVTILSVNPITDKIEVVYAEKFEEKHIPTQVLKIEQLIDRFNVQGVVADLGFGQAQIQMLQDTWGNMIQSCYYTAGSKNPDDIIENEDSTKLTVDRSNQLFKTFDLFKEKQVVFPYAQQEKAKELFAHYTCVEAEPVAPSSGRTGYTKVIKPKSKNDDALHSLNYARIALEIGSQKVEYEGGDERHFNATSDEAMSLMGFNLL